MPKEFDKIKPLDEQADFVMSFVDDSADKREDLEAIWDEVDDNYLVRPPFGGTFGTSNPLDVSLGATINGRARNTAILKDPETHQEIMTLLAKIVLTLFPTGGGFCSSKSVGFEDIPAAIAVGKLEEHAFRLPGHYWAKVNQLLQALLRGTGIGRWTWKYEQEARAVRQFSVDPLTGMADTIEQILMVPVWDDPNFRCTDARDFYPDHSQELLIHMVGAAEHFRLTAADAMRFAASGIYEKAKAIEAIESRSTSARENEAKRSEALDDVSPNVEAHPDFMQLDAYEYYGETPFKTRPGDESYADGIHRNVVTVINGITVRSAPWPRRLPFTEIKVIPRPGSFWGLSVGELTRFDQDFIDTVKMMLADAIVRMTHPPFIYDKNAEVDIARLRKFQPRVPIGANRVDAVQTLNYQPQLNYAFQMYGGVKGQMRDASSALDSLQGQVGPDREAATTSQLRYQAAQSRPELFAAVCEREWLPLDGRIVLELYQEFIDPNDPEELARRIGQSEIPISLLDIAGDFDIEFIGSRVQSNRVQRIESFREIVAAGSNPIIAQINPWIPLLKKFYKELGQEEIAAMVGDPIYTEIYSMLMASGGGKTNSLGANNAQTSSSPPGLLPAQSSGVTQGE